MKSPKILAFSALKNAVELYELGNAQGAALVVIGGMHGDEPEGSLFVEDFLKNALNRTTHFSSRVLVIPNLNPDGLASKLRVNGRIPMGVDLNRNFPSPDWSKEHTAPRYYPGPNPTSEPETQALVDLLKKERPFLVVHVHTYSPQINYTGKISEKWAQKLARDFGHPITDNIGYPTPGSLGQYCHLVLRTACVCIELPENVERDTAWKMVGPALIDVAREGNQ